MDLLHKYNGMKHEKAQKNTYFNAKSVVYIGVVASKIKSEHSRKFISTPPLSHSNIRIFFFSNKKLYFGPH